MFFLVAKDFLEQGAGGVIADFGGDLDGFVQVLDRVHLEREIAFKLPIDVVADINLPDVGHVGSCVEEKNAVHEFFGVNHFFNGFLAVMCAEVEIAPVIAHLAVEEVLIDGCELGLQRFAQVFLNSVGGLRWDFQLCRDSSALRSDNSAFAGFTTGRPEVYREEFQCSSVTGSHAVPSCIVTLVTVRLTLGQPGGSPHDILKIQSLAVSCLLL
jgi:hypothetical protein